MRILVITDKLYPDECGGSCTVAYETIREWQKNNEVDIFTIKKTKTSKDELFKGKIYRELNKANFFKSGYKLSQILRKNKYDIILFHSVISWYIYNLSRIFYKKNIMTIAIFHGPWSKEAIYKYQGKKQKIKEKVLPKLMLLLEKKYVEKNSCFIFLSEYMKNELEQINSKLKYKKTYIIPGGIDIEKYKRQYTKQRAKELLKIDYSKKAIFILRRLDKRMGIDDAIEAFSKIDENERNEYEIIVGGKGNYLNCLKKIADKYNVNVRFEGFIPDEKLNMYFCATDLFIVPSKDLEGFGLVNLESLAMGVPVLARPQGGMIELKNKFNNFFLSENMGIEELKNKIIELSNRFKNKIIEENMNEYSWKNISSNYIKIFEELLNNENRKN